MALLLVTFVVALLAGGIASVAGFGIGSLLTPLLSVPLGTRLAVAAVSIPHAAGTAARLWRLRDQVNRRVLWSFGLASAAGGLAGAVGNAVIATGFLTLVLAGLLVLAGSMELTGLTSRVRFTGTAAWIAGGLSGVFGGLVGNQGGIRTAALLGVDLQRDAFVATATAIALMVDLVRVPVYLATQGTAIAAQWPVVTVATAGVLLGTHFGTRVLQRIPERLFRTLVSLLILALGIALGTRGIRML